MQASVPLSAKCAAVRPCWGLGDLFRDYEKVNACGFYLLRSLLTIDAQDASSVFGREAGWSQEFTYGTT